MHLLSARPAGAEDVEEPVDLGQSPGDIVVLSAADTELGCLAAARAGLPADFPSLRLANLQRLGHPLSVDLYLERVVEGARLVVVRLLGGRPYWAYGVDQLATFCRERGIGLALLPGDAREDPELAERSTVAAEDRAQLWGYLVHGGIGNSGQLLRFAATLFGRAETSPRDRGPAPA